MHRTFCRTHAETPNLLIEAAAHSTNEVEPPCSTALPVASGVTTGTIKYT